MEAPEVEHQVGFRAPVEIQGDLIEQLESGDNDVTSAKAIFDSSRPSLSFYMHLTVCVFSIFRHDRMRVVPDEIVEEIADDQTVDFAFRPLTEEEKKEFVDCLSAKGGTTLAELVGEEEDPSKLVAANQNLQSTKVVGTSATVTHAGLGSVLSK
jgi:hypothetical protein